MLKNEWKRRTFDKMRRPEDGIPETGRTGARENYMQGLKYEGRKGYYSNQRHTDIRLSDRWTYLIIFFHKLAPFKK